MADVQFTKRNIHTKKLNMKTHRELTYDRRKDDGKKGKKIRIK